MPGHGTGLSARWRDASTSSLMLPSVGSRCGQPISSRMAGLVNPSSRPRRDSSPRGAGSGDPSGLRWRQHRARASRPRWRILVRVGSSWTEICHSRI